MGPYFVKTSVITSRPIIQIEDALEACLVVRQAGSIMSSPAAERPWIIGSDPLTEDGLSHQERQQVQAVLS